MTEHMIPSEITTLIPRGESENTIHSVEPSSTLRPDDGHLFRSLMSGLALVSVVVFAVLSIAQGSNSNPEDLLAGISPMSTGSDSLAEYTVVEIYQAYGPNNFKITNKTGDAVFLVDSVYHASSSYGLELSFQDTQGNELALIKGDSSTWVNYQIERDGQPWAEFTSDPSKYGEKKGSWFSFQKKLWMDMVGQENDYKIVAPNGWSWGSTEEYTVERTSNGALAGRITYFWSFSNQNTYHVVVEQGQDDMALLLISVVLDLIYYNDKKNIGGGDDDDDTFS